MNNIKLDNLDVSIKNYIGQLEEGVVVLLSIKYNNKIYEGTYWYDKTYKVLTIEEDMEKEFGNIEEMDRYDELMEFLDNNTSDFEEIYSTLTPIKV